VAISPGVANICLPKKILIVDAIPIMATGKVDYPAVIALVSGKLLN
jgi:acyl-[acyl-carrier-protein]-phospholipid O-acyltransferase/long-chain-fatty-acid--[acyl-carrier-protein] ligase